MAFGPTTFLIFSLEPWGDMWYSKHHYAAYLAKKDRVYFINLPDRWRWRDLFSIGIKVRPTPEGVHVVEYRNNLPLNILPARFRYMIGRLNAWKLRRLMKGADRVVHWCFYPTSILNGKSLRRNGAKVIYHVVDPYQNLPNDTRSAINADLIVAINPWYLRYYGRLNDNCILIPHGVREEDIRALQDLAMARRTDLGDYAILATGLNRFVNYGLLLKLADHFPDTTFVIAGQLFPMRPELERMRDDLFARPNVEYVGLKHPDELRDLIRGARVGLLTYDFEVTRSIPVSAGRTPLKVLTYLSQLCPVVSTNNSYVPPLDGKGYYKAENDRHFISILESILKGERGVDTEAVTAYIRSVEYGVLVNRIMERVEAVEGTPVESGSQHQKIESRDRSVIPHHSPILIISNEAWDVPRYSKHRYAMALGEYREVLFIDPAPQWEPMHLLRWRVRRRDTPEGVIVLSYFNVVPLFGGLLGGLNDMVVSWRIRHALEKEGRKDIVLWTFDPSRLVSPGYLHAYLAIYHCADDHSFRMRGEHLLAERCDHVFCIAKGLMPRFEALSSSVHHVPHGISPTDMSPVDADRSNIPYGGGYGLYIGNINDRHDFELWRKVVEMDLSQKWVVVGPMNVTDPVGLALLKAPPPNLTYLGPVLYNELRELIAAADFGFLFMKRNDPANRFSSQKIVQFIALGKPFFCSWFSEYEDKQDLVHMSDDHETALTQLRLWRSFGEAPDAVSRRLKYAESLCFDELIAHLPFRF